MINNVVHVRHSVNKVKGKDVLGAPKAPYSVREVPLNKKAMDVLMREKERASSDKASAFDGDCYVFPGNITGTSTELGSLNRYIKEACRQIEQAGNGDFPMLTSHDMRHNFTMQAIENGMSLQTLKSTLG